MSIGVLAEAGVEAQRPEKYFQVTVAVLRSSPLLRPGMTGKVEIRSQEARRVLAVPAGAVFQHSNEWYCYVASGRSFEMKPVVTGAHNETWVEVKGLARGDVVALSEPPEAERIHAATPIPRP